MDEKIACELSLPEGCNLAEEGPNASQEWLNSLWWLIRLRWLAGVGVLVATWIAEHLWGLNLATGPLYAIGVGILGYNVFFSRRLTQCCRSSISTPRAQVSARLQITADWVAMTLLIHFSGGVESPLFLYFFFHIILAAILLAVRDVYLFTGLAIFLFGGDVLLEYAGILPHIAIGGFLPAPLYQSPLYVGGVLFFFSSTLLVIAYLTTRATRQLREREAEALTLSRDLQRTYRRLQTLYTSAQVVSSTLELQEVLDRLTRKTAEVMGVKACVIRLLDKTGTRLNTVSVHGLSESYLQKGVLLLAQSLMDREALAGKAVTVNNVATDERLQYPEAAFAEGIRSILTVSLPGREGPLGVIRLYCSRVQRFTDEDAVFLSTMATHGSIAIENALAYQSLQNLEEAKRKFVLMVTHELRAPVGVVRSLLRTLEGGYAGHLEDLQHDLAARALHRADFLQTLIDELLELATYKTGLREVLAPQPVNVNAVLSNVVERYAVPAGEKHLTLNSQLDAGAPPLMVAATEEGLDRVFTNLVSNAVKYTPEGGEVTVRLQSVMGRAQIEVTDSGIGISEEALAHLFEEFYRAPNARAAVKEGTGLGLVVAKDIVTRYGGSIQVQSQTGQGTTFTVTLPILAASPEGEAA